MEIKTSAIVLRTIIVWGFSTYRGFLHRKVGKTLLYGTCA